MIAVLVPVLDRPHRAQPLADAFREATTIPYRLVFLCSLGDDEEYEACNRTGELTLRVPWPAGAGDWARKINHGYRHTTEPWLLCGADDLAPQRGWAEAALEVAEATGAGVVGTNDLGNPTVMRGDHSTHPLVARWYADERGTVDGPGQVVTEAYGHQWTDTELVQTARSRGAWAFAKRSHVTHLHPFWGKGQDDATYRKGMASSREDQRLFRSRSRLWSSRQTV